MAALCFPVAHIAHAQTALPNLSSGPIAVQDEKAPIAQANPQDIENNKPLSPSKRALETMTQCATEKERVERLACFDRGTRALGLITEDQLRQETKVVSSYGLWAITTKKDNLGIETITLKLGADEELVKQSGMRARPNLVIRCASKRTEVLFDWNSPLRNNGAIEKMPLRYAIDGAQMVEETWTFSEDGFALFAPDPNAMIRKLREGSVAKFSLTPPGDPPASASFDLRGMKGALGVLIQRCYI